MTTQETIQKDIKMFTENAMQAVEELISAHFELPEGADTKQYARDIKWLKERIQMDAMYLVRGAIIEVKNNIPTNF